MTVKMMTPLKKIKMLISAAYDPSNNEKNIIILLYLVKKKICRSIKN